MTNFTHTGNFNHHIDDIFQLIMDVESYPEFLPWCSAARIVEENDNEVIADLVISYKAFTEQYRSKIDITHPDGEHTTIKVSMISGPFKFLNNTWRLTKIDEKLTKVDFYISFEFKSVVLGKLIGTMFSKAADKMMEAFENRAEELYGIHNESGSD